MTNFDIQIVSDTLCPWCYIGYKRLQHSIALFQKVYPGAKNDTFTIHWAPYYLRPDASSTSQTLDDILIGKHGADAQKIKNIMDRSGASEAIRFNYNGKLGNTRDSHKVIALAEKRGAEVQSKVAEDLFRGVFEEEQDITSHEFLVNTATAAGLERDEVLAELQDSESGRQIDEDVRSVKEKGVRGVPHFTINREHEMSGSQDPSEWMEVFTAIKEGKPLADHTGAATC
ncbi:MAG: hypothetical protein M1820_006126 [Bogoriella megaspora]|nr:MAG: hypothetical protein M1820_006126 [Bogoriella megaspora]